MTGLIPRADYDRLAERCDRLESENTALRREVSIVRGTRRLVAFIRALTLTPGQARILVALSEAQHPVAHETLLERAQSDSNTRLLYTEVSRVRSAIRKLGGPQTPIISAHGIGYELTPDARAWLRERTPEAFPQPGGPTR